MADLISPSDKKLLIDHNVKIEIDSLQKCSFIIMDNRRLKVTLESRKNEKGSLFKPLVLESEQMTETANKVAVMLLKKGYLQSKPEEPMKILINATVVAFRSEKKFLKHEEGGVNFNTRMDYDALVMYVYKYLTEENKRKKDHKKTPLTASDHVIAVRAEQVEAV